MLLKPRLLLLSFCFAFLPSISFAHNSPEHVSFAKAVELAAPSVVNIYTRRSGSSASPNIPTRDKNWSVRGIKTQTNTKRREKSTLGSGVIIDKNGYILTNNHVVSKAARITVTLNDGRKTLAKLVGTDPDSDLAVIRINFKNTKPIEIDTKDDVKVGDVVLAIGNPFGLGQTVTQGIVSAIGRSTVGINQLENYIQTDAAINPGNSGGALINTKGELIGINTGIYSRSGGHQGVGFAIPVDIALNIMQQIIRHGTVERGWLGLGVQTMDLGLSKAYKIKSTVGVLVSNVVKGSPAAKAGFKKLDLITQIGGQKVYSARGFLNNIAQRQPGTKVTVAYLRDGEKDSTTLVVGKRPVNNSVLDDRYNGPSMQNPVQRKGGSPDDR